MKGRKPVPTALRILRGNPSGRRLPDEPTSPALDEHTEPPTWIDAPARHEWRRLLPGHARAGVMTELDVDAFAAYCQTVADWKRARTMLRRKGPMMKAPNGYEMPSPWLAIATRAQAMMLKLQAEFGMTPSSRSRVTKAAPAAAPANPLQKFLR